VTAEGPNGTPVHKRTATIYASNSVTSITNNTSAPEKFELLQIFPNPFNPSTRIDYALAKNTSVKLTVYNSAGKQVQVFNQGLQSAGRYFVNFKGDGLASGVYYYKLETEYFTETRKMLLIK